MSKDNTTSRRAFLKTGAIAAAPLAAVGVPVAALAADGSKARLARLEDERAIGDLHGRLLRSIGNGHAPVELFAHGKTSQLQDGVRGIAPDHAAEPEEVAFSDDGKRATRRQPVTVEIAHELEGDGTLIQMARLQGNTPALATLPKTLVAQYVRTGGGWAIESIALA
jgi:hypothetical protein